MKKKIATLIFCLSALLLNACAVMPEGAKPITSFKKRSILENGTK